MKVPESAPVVIVTPRHAAEWRGKLIAVGPSAFPVSCEADRCVVLPIEHCLGFSAEPVVIRKAIVSYELPDGRRSQVGFKRLDEVEDEESARDRRAATRAETVDRAIARHFDRVRRQA